MIEDLLPGWTALAQELGAVAYEPGTVKTVSAGLFTSLPVMIHITARQESHHCMSERLHHILIWRPVSLCLYALCIWRGG